MSKLTELLLLLQAQMAKAKIIADNLEFEISCQDYAVDGNDDALQAAFGSIEKVKQIMAEIERLQQ